jgi:hypothetical protein
MPKLQKMLLPTANSIVINIFEVKYIRNCGTDDVLVIGNPPWQLTLICL